MTDSKQYGLSFSALSLMLVMSQTDFGRCAFCTMRSVSGVDVTVSQAKKSS